MSEENVELARRYYEVFNAGGVDATEALRHPEVEVDDPPTLPDAGRYVGEPAVRRLIESYLEVGWDGQIRDPEFLDAGTEVLVVWQLRGHSPHGGRFPIELTVAHLLRFEDARVRRIRQYLSREEGLEAAGLSE
jgi:ketosteroid isomerase-like protein